MKVMAAINIACPNVQVMLQLQPGIILSAFQIAVTHLSLKSQLDYAIIHADKIWTNIFIGMTRLAIMLALILLMKIPIMLRLIVVLQV